MYKRQAKVGGTPGSLSSTLMIVRLLVTEQQQKIREVAVEYFWRARYHQDPFPWKSFTLTSSSPSPPPPPSPPECPAERSMKPSRQAVRILHSDTENRRRGFKGIREGGTGYGPSRQPSKAKESLSCCRNSIITVEQWEYRMNRPYAREKPDACVNQGGGLSLIHI